MEECGVQWPSVVAHVGERHRCIRPLGHGGLAHECRCGSTTEFHHDDDEDRALQDGGW